MQPIVYEDPFPDVPVSLRTELAKGADGLGEEFWRTRGRPLGPKWTGLWEDIVMMASEVLRQ